MARRPVDLMAAVEEEIRGEKASSLGRMGDRLETALAELAQLAAALDDGGDEADDEARTALVDAYNACRERAHQALYWLCVQREAMGLTRHDDIFAIYPIPPRRRR
jgi:hypothetical protein